MGLSGGLGDISDNTGFKERYNALGEVYIEKVDI